MPGGVFFADLLSRLLFQLRIWTLPLCSGQILAWAGIFLETRTAPESMGLFFGPSDLARMHPFLLRRFSFFESRLCLIFLPPQWVSYRKEHSSGLLLRPEVA